MIKTKNNLPQSRLNCTENKDKNRCNHYQSSGSIPTSQQLQLFTTPPTPSDDPPAYPLQIGYIPDKERVTRLKFCQLIHHESGLNIPGQFSYSEAKEILEITRYWDWELDRDRIPRCIEKLRSLLENVCSRSIDGGEANG